MADKTIDDLTAASALDGTEIVHVDQGGNSRKATTKAIARAGFSGALVKKSVNQTAVNITAETPISFDSEVYDTDGFHDNAVNNSRLTVPSGVSYVKVGASLAISSLNSATWCAARIYKNGGGFDGFVSQAAEIGTTVNWLTLVTGPIPVSPGDYFELIGRTESDASVTIDAVSNFWIEVIA